MELNKKIVERIYKEDKTLERFFEILESKKNLKIFEFLNDLAKYFYFIDSTIAMEILEYGLKILETKKYNDTLKSYEVLFLNSLAYMYKRFYNLNSAIKLEKKALNIAKNLYLQDKKKWFNYYIRALVNLAFSYKKKNNIKESIQYEEEAYKIIKSNNYNIKDDKKAEIYTRILINLAYSYKRLEKINEALKLEQEALTIREKKYKENKIRWKKLYLNILNNIQTTYNILKDTDKLILIEEKILKINKKEITNANKNI